MQRLPHLGLGFGSTGGQQYYFRIKPKVKGGSKDLIAGKRELDGLIKGTDFENLDLLPADFSFRNLDLVLDAKKKPTRQLIKLLKPLGGFIHKSPSTNAYNALWQELIMLANV